MAVGIIGTIHSSFRLKQMFLSQLVEFNIYDRLLGIDYKNVILNSKPVSTSFFINAIHAAFNIF